ncbi:hypothetical protein PROFUN_09836 [Planoprotostelium fungivorum]|uniref:Uncharacterized protein n=1 Tax=Planoprotostelium fungivorum TaxID=1890364 RepID=A0A2P6NFP9_9EUKA|nr:hypothetical protein PROFUN_09836 [Planoprotostelium fungivorum]
MRSQPRTRHTKHEDLVCTNFTSLNNSVLGAKLHNITPLAQNSNAQPKESQHHAKPNKLLIRGSDSPNDAPASHVQKPSYTNGNVDRSFKGENVLTEALLSAEKKVENVLKQWKEVPSFLQDNRWIYSGYRSEYSIQKCCKSVFSYHNVNYFLEAPSTTDRIIFYIYLISACAQMSFSTFFHTFACSSASLYVTFAKLDFSGITLMIVASNIPPVFYSFACHPHLAQLYISTIIILGSIGLVLSLSPLFAKTKYRQWRLGFFVFFGLFGAAPIPHLFMIESPSFIWPILSKIFMMGALYSLGAVFYATRWPERSFPGKFDYGLSSHVIWHILVMTAAYVQLWACITAYQQRKATPCTI